MSDNDEIEDPISPKPKSISRRRLMIALGFGAVNLGMLRKLPQLFKPDSTISTSSPSPNTPTTTVASTPSTTTSPSASLELPPVFDADLTVDPEGHTFDLVISGGRVIDPESGFDAQAQICLLYTSPSPRDRSLSRMPSSA